MINVRGWIFLGSGISCLLLRLCGLGLRGWVFLPGLMVPDSGIGVRVHGLWSKFRFLGLGVMV